MHPPTDLDCKWATFDLKGNMPQLDLISMSFCHFFIFAISLSVLRSIMASGYSPFGIFNFSDFQDSQDKYRIQQHQRQEILIRTLLLYRVFETWNAIRIPRQFSINRVLMFKNGKYFIQRCKAQLTVFIVFMNV